jgi:hypothetical protein
MRSSWKDLERTAHWALHADGYLSKARFTLPGLSGWR